MQAKDRLIIALDVNDITHAKLLVEQTRDYCHIYKIGLEFFFRYGIKGVEEIQAQGVQIFLDLKLHDIPNTVYSAMMQVLPLKPRFLTMHASGGESMLEAGNRALLKSQGQSPITTILAVSVLTHLSKQSLLRMRIPGSIQEIAANWLKPLQNNKNFGAVCSPQESKHLRHVFGPDFSLVCPGIRPTFSLKNDQTRVATPKQAIYDGANFLVVGRPITRATDPKLAARSVIHEIESVVQTQ